MVLYLYETEYEIRNEKYKSMMEEQPLFNSPMKYALKSKAIFFLDYICWVSFRTIPNTLEYVYWS
jgi:hypothetical protein